MKNEKLSKIVKTGILTAIAFVIMFIEAPLPLFPEFLKLDFSDIPALLAAFSLGPVWGLLVELVKNLLHFITATKTMGIGELANFVMGGIFAFTAGLIYLRNKTKKGAILGLVVGSILMSIVAAITNYYVFIPLYGRFLFPLEAILAASSKVNGSIVDLKTLIIYSILPFNFIKAVLVSFVTFLVYKRFSPYLNK